ncbi:MAG: M3 family oligoendopeptidase [Candidatus Sericytochromatia bacterium]|nr:M3 family oligoendopeptidase [Candidatus Sericytochromatia bacterium]
MTTTTAPRWDLGRLYAGLTAPALDADMARAMERAEVLRGRYRGRLAALTPAEMRTMLETYEGLQCAMGRLGAFASLSFSADSRDDAARALYARMRSGLTEIHTELQFLELELQQLEYDRFTQLLEAPELARYRYWLEQVRRFGPHTLSDGEERLAAIKDVTGQKAWTQLYVEITAGLTVTLPGPEGERRLTLEEARALRADPDRATRQAAMEGVYRAHEAHAHVLTYIFNTVFEDHRQMTALRHYPDPMAPTLLGEDLAPEVVEALMAATEAHYHLAHRYYRTKARVLGIPDFASHDVLAPYGEATRRVPYDEGRAIVLDAMRSFSPRFETLSEGFFTGRYIDVPPGPGKQGGAFCAGMVPDLHPYVLLNYTDTLQDVLTLAHELGHGIHFLLAGEAQNFLNYYPITPLAETASTFAEIITLNRLLAQEQDPLVRRQLLATQVEDAISTVMRQVMYTRWEQRAHAMRKEGVVPADAFSGLWAELSGELYGDAVRRGELDRWGWITIPHLVKYRFYCYSYAFGQLLVYALYQRYLEEGEALVPQVLDLLAAGGSAPATELLGRIGVDITDPGFWRKGFQYVETMLEAFEAAVADAPAT